VVSNKANELPLSQLTFTINEFGVNGSGPILFTVPLVPGGTEVSPSIYINTILSPAFKSILINISAIFINCMNFNITESQLRLIVLEGTGNKFTDSIKEMASFANSVVNKVKKKYSLNTKLLLTWGAALGGLMLPLDNLIKNKKVDLDEYQVALILVGVAAALFYDNKKYFDRIYEEIKKQNLENIFKEVLLKGVKLKNSFVKFIKSLYLSINSVSEIIAYAFLVPIITDIMDFLHTGDFEKNLVLIVKRILASGSVGVAAELLKELLRKISKRVSN